MFREEYLGCKWGPSQTRCRYFKFFFLPGTLPVDTQPTAYNEFGPLSTLVLTFSEAVQSGSGSVVLDAAVDAARNGRTIDVRGPEISSSWARCKVCLGVIMNINACT